MHGCLVIAIGVVAAVVVVVGAALAFPQAAPTILLVGAVGVGLPVAALWVLALVRAR